MECKDVLERIDSYFENKASDIENHNIDRHLLTCNSCRQEYEEYGKLFDILSNHRVVSPPADFTDNVMASVEAIDKNDRMLHYNSYANINRLGLSFLAAGLLIVALNTSILSSGLKEISTVLFKGSVEINYNIVNSFDRMSRGLSYVSDFWFVKQDQ